MGIFPGQLAVRMLVWKGREATVDKNGGQDHQGSGRRPLERSRGRVE